MFELKKGKNVNTMESNYICNVLKIYNTINLKNFDEKIMINLASDEVSFNNLLKIETLILSSKIYQAISFDDAMKNLRDISDGKVKEQKFVFKSWSIFKDYLSEDQIKKLDKLEKYFLGLHKVLVRFKEIIGNSVILINSL